MGSFRSDTNRISIMQQTEKLKDKNNELSGEVYTDKVVKDIIKAFNITFKQFSMYPLGHPSLDLPIANLFRFIESLLMDSDNLTIAIAPKRIYICEKIIKELKSTHHSFINFLDRRNISKIQFSKGLTLNELKEFIATISTDPNKLERSGKIEEILSSKGLRYASASSIDYTKLVEKDASLSKDPGKQEEKDRWDNIFKDFLLHDGVHLSDEAKKVLLDQSQNLHLLQGIINKTIDTNNTEGTKDEEKGKAVAKTITRIGQATTQQPEEVKDKITNNIAEILTDIEPTIRNQTFLSKIMSLNENREFVSDIESKLSHNAIGEILATLLIDKSISDKDKIEVYNRMTPQASKRERILSILKNKISSPTMTKWEDIATLSKSLNFILKSSGDEKYMSDSYQQSLEQIQSIATEKLFSLHEEEIFEKYKLTIKPENIRTNKEIVISEILINSKDPVADRFIVNELEQNLISNIKNGDIHVLEKVMPLVEQYSTESDIDTPCSNELRELAQRIVKNPNFKGLIFLYAKAKEENRSIYLDIIPSFGVQTVPVLLDILGDLEDYSLYQPIICMIERFYTKAIPGIEAFIEKRWERIDPFLIHFLGRIGGPSRPEFILENYQLKEPAIKKALLEISPNVWTDEIFALVKEGLKEGSEEIRISALRALGKNLDEKSQSLLLRILQDPSLYGRGRDFFKEVIKTCAIPGYSKAIPYLKKIFNQKGWFFYKKKEELRLITAESLAIIGTKEAQRILSTGLKDKNPEVKTLCRKLLKKMKTTDDEDSLQSDMSSLDDVAV